MVVIWSVGRAQPCGCRSVAEAAARLRCAKFHGGLIVQGRMRSLVVVPLPVLLAEHFRLQHRSEGFPVQELVSKAAVKTFAIGILPRAAGRDAERLEPTPRNPLLLRQRRRNSAVAMR